MRDRRRSCSPGAIQQPWCLVLQLYFLKFDRRIKKQTNKNRKNPTKTPQVVETKASVTKDVCCHTQEDTLKEKCFWAPVAPLLTNTVNTQMYLRRLQLPWAKLQEGDGFSGTSASNKCLVVRKVHIANRLQNGIITTSSGPCFAQGQSTGLI